MMGTNILPYFSGAYEPYPPPAANPPPDGYHIGIYAPFPPEGSQAAPTIVTAPNVSGTATVGGTLTSTAGIWTGSPTSHAYQWQGDGAAIVGATAATYTVAAGDVGKSLACAVTATNAEGSATALSNAIVAAT